MADLKFRAWDGEVFLYVDLNEKEDMSFDFIRAFFKSPIKEQFADIQDLDGKDIYEGDIVEVSYYFNDEMNYDVEDSKFYIIRRGIYEGIDEYVSGLYIPDNDPDNMRIRGNIHQNPELIEKCENKDD